MFNVPLGSEAAYQTALALKGAITSSPAKVIGYSVAPITVTPPKTGDPMGRWLSVLLLLCGGCLVGLVVGGRRRREV